jgi:hypothetical protein
MSERNGKMPPRLTKTAIEYGEYHWGFYSGCQHGDDICPINSLCWNLPLTWRFPKIYPNGRKPTFYPEAFLSPLSLKKPARILVCFGGDLFGDWVDPLKNYTCFYRKPDKFGVQGETGTLLGLIWSTIKACPQHTFLFLTKNPQGYLKWVQSEPYHRFPENVWIGATVCHDGMMKPTVEAFDQFWAKVKFISFEPLLGRLSKASLREIKNFVCQWVIIGALTGTKTALQVFQKQYPQLTLMPYGKRWSLQPRVSWISEIIDTCKRVGIPYFLKNNLLPLLGNELVQDMPKGVDFDH